MPKYTVKDNKTNKTITFDWYADTPPTERDMAEISAEAETFNKDEMIASGRPILDRNEQIQADVPQWKKTVAGVGRPVLEAGGMIGGGLAGSFGGPAAPVTIPAMGIAGYGAGASIADILEEKLGTRPPTKSIGEAASRTGGHLKTGAWNEALGGLSSKLLTALIGKAISPLSKEMSGSFLKTQREIPAETASKIAAIGKKGYPATPADVAPNAKTLGILEGVLGYRPLAGDVMLKRNMAKMDKLMQLREQLINKNSSTDSIEMVGNKIRNEAKDIISKYTDKQGAALDDMANAFVSKYGSAGRHEAGTEFANVMNENLASRQVAVKGLYETAKGRLPKQGSDIVPFSNETVSTAKKLLKEETSKLKSAQDSNIIQTLQEIIDKGNSKDAWAQRNYGKSWDSLAPASKEAFLKHPDVLKQIESEGMTWQGLDSSRSAFLEKTRDILKSTGGKPTNETRVLTELSKAIDNDMGAFAEKQGGEVWDIFKQGRSETKTMHELFNKDMLNITNKPPEDILGKLTGRNEVTLLKQVKDTVGEEGMAPIRQAYFKQILDSSTKDGVLNPFKLRSNIAKTSEETLNELMLPEQKKALQAIADKGIALNEKMLNMKSLEFLNSISGIGNDKAVDALFRNDFTIKAGKRLLSPERIKELTSHVLDRHILKTTGNGDYLPVSSAKAFRENADKLKHLLPPDQYNNLVQLITLGKDASKLEALAKNSSQTGQTIIGSHGMDLILHPKMLAKYLALPYVISKAYTSNAAMKYITSAAKLPANSPAAINYFIKAVAIMEQEKSKNKEVINHGHEKE